MCAFKLSHGIAMFTMAILSVQVPLVAAQYTTATSVINGQAQWQGTAVSTNPLGIPTLVSTMPSITPILFYHSSSVDKFAMVYLF